MDFGWLDNVDDVNWDLPEEDLHTHSYLSSFVNDGTRSQIYMGAPVWGSKKWVGRLYPPKTPATRFLYYYSRYFNCIELNTTHYRIPTVEMVKKWVDQVPEGFLFCPKMPQSFSHTPGGLRNRSDLELWIKSLEAFDSHLGPCFLQMPPEFSYYEDKSELFHFLKSWPDEFELALEFRHPSWFKKGHVLPLLVEYLQSRKIGLVITDVAGRRDVAHTSISAPFSLLRFIGNELHSSDYERAQNWSGRIRHWQKEGLKKFFFMVHEPEDTKTPEMADFVAKVLNLNQTESFLVKPAIQLSQGFFDEQI